MPATVENKLLGQGYYQAGSVLADLRWAAGWPVANPFKVQSVGTESYQPLRLDLHVRADLRL